MPYKDRDKEKEASKERMRKHREKQGVTEGVTEGVTFEPKGVTKQGVTSEGVTSPDDPLAYHLQRWQGYPKDLRDQALAHLYQTLSNAYLQHFGLPMTAVVQQGRYRGGGSGFEENEFD